MKRAGPPPRLSDHDDALASQLIGLLAEVPCDVLPADIDDARAAASEPILSTEKRLNPADDPPLAKSEADTDDASPKLPRWARNGFRALLFRIGAHRFAMPLVLMRSVSPVASALTRVPGQPNWLRGVTQYRGASVIVADLGLLLEIDIRCAEPRYLLVIGTGQEAFECDVIDDAVEIAPDKVRWRRQGNDRAWMVGLLTDEMCGLLDAGVISEKLGTISALTNDSGYQETRF